MKAEIRGARLLHLISALWILGLAVLVVSDVILRLIGGGGIPGSKEILQNSVVTITFLQIPLAIYSGSMLRTTILLDAVPPVMRRLLRTFAALLGFILFLGLIWGTWPSFVQGYRIGEYEGEGSLRVPTWPVRGVVALMSACAALAYLQMIWLDWTGRLISESEAPSALARLED